MANLTSIKNALQIFKTTNATKWAPKTNLKNATVYFEKKIFNDLMTNIAKCKNNYAVIIDEYNSYKGVEIDPWHRIAIDKANGIWIGEGAGVQISIKISNMSLDEKKVDFPHIGYTISKGKHTLIKHMVDKEEVENEE